MRAPSVSVTENGRDLQQDFSKVASVKLLVLGEKRENLDQSGFKYLRGRRNWECYENAGAQRSGRLKFSGFQSTCRLSPISPS